MGNNANFTAAPPPLCNDVTGHTLGVHRLFQRVTTQPTRSYIALFIQRKEAAKPSNYGEVTLCQPDCLDDKNGKLDLSD